MVKEPRPVGTAFLVEWVFARRREGAFGFAFALVCALVLHLLVVPVVHVLRPSTAQLAHAPNRTGPVRLGRADAGQGQRVQIDIRMAPQPPQRPPQEDEEPPEAPGQVVTLAPPEQEERPSMAQYASEWDQRTDRETRSRDARLRPERVAPELRQGRLQRPLAPSSRPQPEAQPASPSLLKQSAGPKGPGRARAGDSGTDATDGAGTRAFAFELPRQAARAPLRLRVDDDGLFRNQEAVPEMPGHGAAARVTMGVRLADAAHRQGSGTVGHDVGQGMAGGGVGLSGLPALAQLTPTSEQMAQAAGAPVSDHLPEVETDDATRLNAWRWKHATFFNRIADAIRKEWQGGDVLRATDPTGRVYGFEDRLTRLQVTVDRAGEVVSVHVAEASGTLALDDEAVRAFRTAGPFSNPPTQLFRGRETFTFEFGFHVTYGRVNINWNWRPD